MALGLGSIALLMLASGLTGWGIKPSVNVEAGGTYVKEDDNDQGLLGGLLGGNFMAQLMPMALIFMMLGGGGNLLGGGSGAQSGPTYIYYDDDDDSGNRWITPR